MKNRIFSLLLCAAILLSSALLTFCDSPRAEAVLHGDGDAYAIIYSASPCDIDVDSPQAFVYDLTNGVMVFTKGEDKVVYPGSTTKLLTALYALSVLPDDRVVTAGDELELVREGSSLAYIKKGHRLTVGMLIEGMLVPSGNDAAYVLAAAVGRELAGDSSLSAEAAIDRFLQGINEYAASIGLCGTLITVPDGYADERHYTTTEDLAIVSCLALDDERVARCASTLSSSVTYASGQTNTWRSTNKLLDPEGEYYSDKVTGLKTGSINNEYSLVFSFAFEDGREYVAGVFGAGAKNTRFEDACVIISALENVKSEK